MTNATVAQHGSVQARAGKFLTFVVAGEEYGMGIHAVREVIAMMDITAVPQMPGFIKGIVNLRGRIIPVMDLRTRFGLEAAEATRNTCIVVVRLDSVEIGIVVDCVREVLEIGDENIADVPSFGAAVDTDFLLGVGKVGERVILLLNGDNILTGREIQALASPSERQ